MVFGEDFEQAVEEMYDREIRNIEINGMTPV